MCLPEHGEQSLLWVHKSNMLMKLGPKTFDLRNIALGKAKDQLTAYYRILRRVSGSSQLPIGG